MWEDKQENRNAHANGPFGGADRAGRMTAMGAKSAPPSGAERPVIKDEAETATENALAERRRSHGNSADREPRQSMPPIDQADVVRWQGREPPDIWQARHI
jgi:hypothetical protein